MEYLKTFISKITATLGFEGAQLQLFKKSINFDMDEIFTYVVNGNIIEIKKAIENGLNINSTFTGQGSGLTILYLAVSKGQTEIANYLIDKGAKFQDFYSKLYNVKLRQPIEYAIRQENYIIVDKLLKKGADRDDLFQYCKTIKMAKFLLDRGCYVWNYPPVIMYTNFEVTKFLVERGAKINVAYDGNTPLSMAVHLGNFEKVKYLISKGAYIHDYPSFFKYFPISIDSRYTSPIIAAIIQGNFKITVFLLKKLRKRHDYNEILKECQKISQNNFYIRAVLTLEDKIVNIIHKNKIGYFLKTTFPKEVTQKILYFL